ncbi:MAG: hypothetical protein ACRCTY_00525, partial [Candidatus Adiutrix sp.]
MPQIKRNEILDYLITGILGLTVFGFFNSPQMSLPSRVLILVIASIFIVAWVKKADYKELIPFKLLGLWFLWSFMAAISVVWTVDPAHSLREFRYDVIFTFLMFFGLLLVLEKKWQLIFIWGAILFSSLVSSLSGIV